MVTSSSLLQMRVLNEEVMGSLRVLIAELLVKLSQGIKALLTCKVLFNVSSRISTLWSHVIASSISFSSQKVILVIMQGYPGTTVSIFRNGSCMLFWITSQELRKRIGTGPILFGTLFAQGVSSINICARTRYLKPKTRPLRLD